MNREFYEQKSLRPPLRIHMMMYGRKQRTRLKRDKDGNKIVSSYNEDNEPIYEKEKYWVNLSKEDGDAGIFPSINEIYRKGYGGKLVYSANAVRKFEEWHADADLWMYSQNWQPTKEKVYLDFYFYMPRDNRRRDTHNVFKMCLDAFNQHIYEDDHTCLPRVIDYCKAPEGVEPYIEIFIHTKEEMDMMVDELLAK